MKLAKSDVYAKVDPRIQRLLYAQSCGVDTPSTACTNEGEIAVIARVKDFKSWKNMSEVYEGSLISKLESGESIVTGRIPLARVEKVREKTLSLKPADPLRLQLQRATEETFGARHLLEDALSNDGEGVVVGVIDYGCDFVHKNFRKPDGTTRILEIWNQNYGKNQSGPYGYGKTYSQEAINRALQTQEPYAELGYFPESESHGTHVMDIAAGNGLGSDVPGFAPKSEIVFVEIAANDVPWIGADVVYETFGDSVQLLEAVKYCFDKAGDKPCVVNISLGTNGGPHDGTKLVEQGIDALVSEKPNRAVVIAASNSYDDGIHAFGKVEKDKHYDLEWRIDNWDRTPNEIEIWYSQGDVFTVEIIQPNGDSLGEVALGENGSIENAHGEQVLFVSHREKDPNNNDNVFAMYVENTLPRGIWTLRIHGKRIAREGEFHAWIERDDRGPSSFNDPSNNDCTLGSISTGHKSIVVGSYDAYKAELPLSWFSSAGPTRDGRNKPEVSAPGHNIWAAASLTETERTRMSGTSMASPAVAGIIALILAEAKVINHKISIDEVRKIIQDTARKKPPLGNAAWHRRYGYGRIDANAALSAVRKLKKVAAHAGAGVSPKPRKKK